MIAIYSKRSIEGFDLPDSTKLICPGVILSPANSLRVIFNSFLLLFIFSPNDNISIA
nr:MAG TPA: hypothetical protein [Caudoviricetes sp.]